MLDRARERDGMMRYALVRRWAWWVYRVHDLATLLTPLAICILAATIALLLG